MSIVIRRIFAAVAAAGPGADQGWVFATKKEETGTGCPFGFFSFAAI